MAAGRWGDDVGPFPDGAWSPDRAHFPKPVTRATGAVLGGRVSAEASERWGVLIAGVDFAVDDDGWMFVREQPVTDPAVAAARAPAAAATRRDRRWLGDVHDWEVAIRPALVRDLLALQDEPIASATDDDVAGHLERAVALARRAWDLHMALHLADMVPLGALLAAAPRWGVAPADVIALMRGHSPASAASPELTAARRAVAGDGSLDHPDVRRWLRMEGHHLVSEPELAAPTVHERPDLVAALLRVPAAPAAPAGDDHEAAAVAAVRDHVPRDERAGFDHLLADAWRTFGLRDDNTRLTAMWPLGIARRAYLEAGRRLSALSAPDDVFALEPGEVTGALHGGDGGGAVAGLAAERRSLRDRALAAPPPDGIGVWEAPAEALLSEDQRWLHRAYDAYNGHFGGTGSAPLSGIGIAGVTVTGPAVVAVSPLDALDRLRPGSILVVAATAPAYDSVLPLAAGLVVETGGLLSHAALAGRELGLPVVVGVDGATRLISDGDLVTVEPSTGRVRPATSSPRP